MELTLVIEVGEAVTLYLKKLSAASAKLVAPVAFVADDILIAIPPVVGANDVLYHAVTVIVPGTSANKVQLVTVHANGILRSPLTPDDITLP